MGRHKKQKAFEEFGLIAKGNNVYKILSEEEAKTFNGEIITSEGKSYGKVEQE